jgi:hypothetical protein
MNISIYDVNLYRILRDDERPPYLPRQIVLDNNQGYPATQPTYEKLKVVTTPEYQFFWRNAIFICAPTAYYREHANDVFRRVTNGGLAWCNGEGSTNKDRPGNADFVNGTNLDREPIKQEMLCSRGNVVNVLSGRESHNGEWWVEIECLNINHLPPVEEAVSKPWLIQAMTTITPEKLFYPDTGYRANPFQDFGGDRRFQYRVPLPIMSKTGTCWLPEAQLVKVNGQVPSPYNPR